MAEETPRKDQRRHKKALLQLLVFFLILIGINILAFFFNGKMDLTRDHRYTLTPTTKELLQNLPEKVDVTVFLTGNELPAAFRRLSRSTIDLLRNFRAISHNKINFEILNPLNDDSSTLNLLRHYRMSGVPVTVSAGKKGTSEKMLFPWALITLHKDKAKEHGFPVFLQQNNTPHLSRSILLSSEMLLEYNLANAIHQITKKKVSSIAYLTGNAEPFGYHVISAFRAIQKLYKLDTLNLKQKIGIPQQYNVVIINKPRTPFTDVEKYKIDQYVMNGGNVYLNIDGATGSLYALKDGKFNAMALNLNLDNLLYNWGVRLNHDLLLDAVKCAGIPLMADKNNPKPVIYPWVYFPVLQAGSQNPIVKNLNGVLGRFVSTLDTNHNDPNIKKTILLQSSNYSKIQPTPSPVLLESAMVEKNPATFLKKNLSAAVLLEGHFHSLYARRMPQPVRQFLTVSGERTIKQEKGKSKIIVAADGDLMMNEFSQKQGPSELGIYRYSDYHFDNKTFLLNSLAYLTDPNNLLAARAKTFEKHLLDPKRVEAERSQWEWINIAVPIALILLLGLVITFVRKKRYA